MGELGVVGDIIQGVVMYKPAVLTPATGIKVRSSSQAVKLGTIKRSRCSFALLKSRSRWVLSFDSTHTPPTPGWQSRVDALLAVRSSDQGPKMAQTHRMGRNSKFDGVDSRLRIEVTAF